MNYVRSFRSFLGSFIRERVVQRFLHISGINRNDRVGALHRAWGHVFTSKIEGAYYEFGVYRGDTFRLSCRVYKDYFNWLQGQLTSEEPWRRKAAEKYGAYRHHFYAFDTFQGIPENQEGDITFAAGSFLCSLEEFRRLNHEAGIVEGEHVRYFVGNFAEVAEREATTLEGLQPAAIANIGCDLYASARDALEIVAPKLIQGSVLLVDDWNVFAADRNAGERKAVREFLETHPELSIESWFPYENVGQAFLVHKNNVRRCKLA